MPKIHVDVGGFSISKEQKSLVNKVLDSGRLTYGSVTQSFEEQWASLHKVKYALFCNSGTSALQVALNSLKEKYHWHSDDEVIIPALTFVATMNIVLHNNMKVKFVDVDYRTYNMDPRKLEEAITSHTKCIIPVHLLGQPADMVEIMAIANRHHLKVIEDSCETVGATLLGRPVGSWGDIGCFSTYASHLVVTGVGGFCTTNDPDLAIRIKGLYNHGRDGVYNSIDDDDKNSISMIEKRFRFVHSGYSYRDTEMESALGVGHLLRFKKDLDKRRSIATQFSTAFYKLSQKKLIQLPSIIKDATHSFMLYPLVLNSKDTRDSLMQYLERNGIMTRYLMPLLSQPIVRKYYGNMDKKFPVSHMLDNRGMLIGCYPEMTDIQVQYVIERITSYFK